MLLDNQIKQAVFVVILSSSSSFSCFRLTAKKKKKKKNPDQFRFSLGAHALRGRDSLG